MVDNDYTYGEKGREGQVKTRVTGVFLYVCSMLLTVE